MQPLTLVQFALLLGFGLFPSLASAQSGTSNPYSSEERILLEGTIDQKPARFLFDTGASFTALFASPATRLGLKSETNRTVKIAGHDVLVGLTRPVDIVLLGKDANTRLPILPFPAPAECDGVFGWRTFGDSSFFIDAPARRLRNVNELPASGWLRWPLDLESSQLFFTVNQDGRPLGRVFVDTGSPLGLRIAPHLWSAWRKANPKTGVTLTTYRYAVGEPMVHELAWTAEYSLGDLVFHEVDIGPIPEARDGRAVDASGKEFIATIGMRGLQHLRMIVSRESKEVLTQSVSPIPAHNRLGAVFLPGPKQTGEANPPLLAQVLKNSPADKHGLKHGDVLLSINGVNFDSPATGGLRNPESFLMQPAGTELILKVKRGQSIHEFTITLRDLLP